MTRTASLPAITLKSSDFSRLDDLATAAERTLPDVAESLGRELERAKIVPSAKIGRDIVTMGARVVFRDDAEQTHDVRLVYPHEADLEEGRISVMTPVGVALIGLKVGQSIRWQPRLGEQRTLTVLDVAQHG